MAKCKSCSKSDVSGIEAVPYKLLATAVAGNILAKKVGKMLTTNTDGTPKADSFLVKNPMVRQLGMVAIGIGATMFADGNELITGAGLGVATEGAMEFIASKAPQLGIAGYAPTQIAGYAPTQIGAMHQRYAQRMQVPTPAHQKATVSATEEWEAA